MDWYYGRQGQRHGPVPEAALRELLARGELGPEDLVWRPGLADWQPARAMPELAAASPPPLAAAPGALSMRWLPAYVVILAVLGVLNLLSPFVSHPLGPGAPGRALTIVSTWVPGVLSLFVAHGLHRRRRWAWQVNHWIFLVLPLVLAALVALGVGVALVAMRGPQHGPWEGRVGVFVAFFLMLAILSLWPGLNLLYFRKRRHLFTA